MRVGVPNTLLRKQLNPPFENSPYRQRWPSQRRLVKRLISNNLRREGGGVGVSNLATQSRQEVYLSVRATLDVIASLNREFLDLLLLESTCRWPGIAAIIRSRADCVSLLVDACPFALFDVRFGDMAAWASVSKTPVSYEHTSTPADLRRCTMLSAACFLTWHLARHSPTAAILLLRSSREVIQTISSLSLVRIQQIPFEHAEWLQPRWSNQADAWRELVLLTASQPENPALARSRALSLFFGNAGEATSPSDSG